MEARQRGDAAGACRMLLAPERDEFRCDATPLIPAQLRVDSDEDLRLINAVTGSTRIEIGVLGTGLAHLIELQRRDGAWRVVHDGRGAYQ